MRTWMLLVYQLPNKPTAGRVFVWRKLKRLGAILLHDAVWVLPATTHTREQFRWLASEIEELNGDATVWECRQTLMADEEQLVEQFTKVVDRGYRQILADLRRKRPDLLAISRRYQLFAAQDHFNSQFGQRVRDALVAAKGERK